MSLPTVVAAAGVRARRWDALVLGSGIPALVAAARMGMAGQRVLVVEEDRARNGFEGLREPFFLAGTRDGGAVDHCLKELALSLIDRRRIVPEEFAFQVLGEDLRMDLGEPELTSNELVAWGLSKPGAALSFVRAVREASEAERKAMLASPIVRVGRRIVRSRLGGAGSHRRGLPTDVAEASAALSSVLAAQVRALSNLASIDPGPESQARLLGSSLAGGAGFAGPPPWLYGMLRRRVEAVFGEFRTLSRRFRMVSVLGQPGIEIEGTGELWVGRILVIAAPPSALARVLPEKQLPGFLPLPRSARRRVSVHLRVARSALPEGMASRFVLLPEPSSPAQTRAAITVSMYSREGDPQRVDLVARRIAEESEDIDSVEAEVATRVLDLLPFHQDKVEWHPVETPLWDDDGWLEDPGPGDCWPGETDIRLSTRPPIYLLDRASIAGLGVEGDVLLGLRAGEALASELG